MLATDLLQCVRTGCNKHDRAQSITSGLISVLIQIVAIIAITWAATLSCSALVSVLLNAVTERAFFRV